MLKTYEDCNRQQRACGKIHQHTARLFSKTLRSLPSTQPLVSICFDDFPESAATHGAAILEKSGLRGTFYTCFSFPNMAEQTAILQQKGHEIGCHTYNHINASFNTADDFRQACQDNITAANKHSIELHHFSYPQGGMSLAAKRFIRAHYASARSGFEGINHNKIDTFCLKSVPLYQNTLKKVDDFVNYISDKGGWLILYSHDVSGTPSPHGISPQALETLVTRLHKREIAVRPVGQVIASLK